jgi:hypothetical protein
VTLLILGDTPVRIGNSMLAPALQEPRASG